MWWHAHADRARLPTYRSCLPPSLQLFTNSAAALPAEIDEHGQLKAPASGLGAWQRRMQASAERRRAEREQRAAAQQQ